MSKMLEAASLLPRKQEPQRRPEGFVYTPEIQGQRDHLVTGFRQTLTRIFLSGGIIDLETGICIIGEPSTVLHPAPLHNPSVAKEQLENHLAVSVKGNALQPVEGFTDDRHTYLLVSPLITADGTPLIAFNDFDCSVRSTKTGTLGRAARRRGQSEILEQRGVARTQMGLVETVHGLIKEGYQRLGIPTDPIVLQDAHASALTPHVQESYALVKGVYDTALAQRG